MLPTFVIGLREGVEASLIVGIVAAFLRQQGRRDALRWMWLGVIAAVALCTAVAVALQVVDRELPQAQQEGLETVVALVAVGMVTFMIVWMKRHARELGGDLRASAASALERGSAGALVAMAFFAVLREGLETAVFLLAAFQASGDAAPAGLGALLGIVAAVLLGFGIYRGGVHLNLGRFFKVTSVALVLVAAGLVMTAIHTAHEATWLNSLQQPALNLSWLVRPGSVESSLLTGVLGLQPQPVLGEVAGWLLYATPMLLFVLWPRRRRRQVAAAVALGCLVVALAGCGQSGGSKTSAAPPQTLSVSLTDAGCSPAALHARTGPVTFEVSNGGTSKVTELELKDTKGVILGERENIVSGIKGSFTLDLQPGLYTVNCPNGSGGKDGVLVVSGKPTTTAQASRDPLLTKATDRYGAYVDTESDRLLLGTRAFVAALRSGDLARAKSLYGPVRYHYEAIEPVAESFGGLDPAIDARANDVPDPAQWTGFHRIEQILWTKGTTRGTQGYATRLLHDVQTLDRRVHTLTFQPAQLANGGVELLNEVANSKITGEEDRYSHTDLSDFAGNLAGARRAFDLLRPALVHRGDGALAATIDSRFAAVQRSLHAYRRPTALGFATYDALTPADRRRFAQEIDALAEPLSTVAAKVSG